MATTVRSYAKINLGLAIGPLRDDGFHTLLTLYQTIAVHDLVTVSARRLPALANRSRISLTSDHARVPCDARNTAWRMIAGALDRMSLAAEVHIHIEKRLPIQGGMGAGSANAAAALIALEHELSLSLPQPDRLALAAYVGSDVPLFLIGGTVLGTGRGEIVEPVPDLPATPCVIALPDLGVSTPRAFRDWDALHEASASLTSPGGQGKLSVLMRAYASSFPQAGLETSSGAYYLQNGLVEETQSRDSRCRDNPINAMVCSGIENDFERVVFSQFSSLSSIKHHLMGSDSNEPALYAALSGSGSALFGLYPSVEAAEAAQHRLQSTGIKALLTETLPREVYWCRMVAETPHRE